MALAELAKLSEYSLCKYIGGSLFQIHKRYILNVTLIVLEHESTIPPPRSSPRSRDHYLSLSAPSIDSVVPTVLQARTVNSEA